MPDTSPQTAATAESALNSVPLHSDYAESQRQRHTRERLAVLSGTWHSILQDRILHLVGSDRFQAMPPASVSTNPFAAICRDLGCLYDGGAPDGGAGEKATDKSIPGVPGFASSTKTCGALSRISPPGCQRAAA